MMTPKSGSTISLSAEGTDAGDDGQSVTVTWWIYREAGTLDGVTLTKTKGLSTEVALPPPRNPGSVHVILQAEDDGTPHLFAYRRVVMQVTP